MKHLLLVLMFASPFAITVQAQEEQSNWQSDKLAQLGLVRMVTRQVTQVPAPEKTKTSETFFDEQGRIVRIITDECEGCGTIQEYDTLTGRVSYVRTTRKNSFKEISYEYDNLSRLIASEQCKNGEEDACILFTYEFDDKGNSLVYKTVQKRQTRIDVSKKPKHFHRIYSETEEKRQLVQENTYTPEGQIAETRNLPDGKFQYALSYEYDAKGHLLRSWHFDGKVRQVQQEAERDEAGRLIRWKTYALTPGDPGHTIQGPSIQTYEYDDQGLLIRISTEKSTTEYAYFTE